MAILTPEMFHNPPMQITKEGRRIKTKRQKKCQNKDQRTGPEDDDNMPFSSVSLMSTLLLPSLEFLLSAGSSPHNVD